MTDNMPLISVVVVSWNVKELVINCVNSILKSTISEKIEVIVVDNNSPDGTAEALNKEFEANKSVHIYASENNLGFARGNNIGFGLAKGRYIFILNPDTLVLPDTIEKLYKSFIEDEQIGMVGPKLVYENGAVQKTCARKLPGLDDIILYECFKAQRWPQNISKYVESKIRFPYNFSMSQYVGAISGAAMFLEADELKRMGMFNPEYMHCGEDVELCWKVLQSGKKIKYCDDATVVHFESQSSKKAVVRTQVNSLISIGLYIRKTKGLFGFWLYRLSILFVKVPLEFFAMLLLFAKGQFKNTSDIKNRRSFLSKIINWKPVNSN